MTAAVSTTVPTRRAYDHRLREHVLRCGPSAVAKHVQIPRSTVSTWRRRGLRPVVTTDPVGQDSSSRSIPAPAGIFAPSPVAKPSFRWPPSCTSSTWSPVAPALASSPQRKWSLSKRWCWHPTIATCRLAPSLDMPSASARSSYPPPCGPNSSVNAVGGAHVSVSTHSSPPSGFGLLGQMKSGMWIRPSSSLPTARRSTFKPWWTTFRARFLRGP